MALFDTLKTVLTPYAEKINELNGSLDDVKADLSENTGTQIITGWIDEYYIQTNGAIGSTLPSPSHDLSWRYVIVPYTKGQKVTINAQGSGGQRLWCFTDSSYKIIDKALSNTTGDNLVISNDNNDVAYLIINDKVKNNVCYFGTALIDMVESNRAELDVVGNTLCTNLLNGGFNDYSAYGIMFDWADNFCHVSGTATSNATCNFVNSKSAIPEYLEIGKTYNVLFSSANVTLRVYTCHDGTQDRISILTTKTNGTFTLPTGISGVVICLVVSNGTTLDEIVSVKITTTYTNPQLTEIVDKDVVKVISQSLTDSEKATVRQNIGAGALSVQNALLARGHSTFSFRNIFKGLTDKYVDDFSERVSFVDENHPYTVFGNSATIPTMETGLGIYTQNAAARAIYARPILKFPFFVSFGKMSGAVMQIALYSTIIGSSLFTQVIQINSTSDIVYNNVAYGTLNGNSKYMLLQIEHDGVYIYDDIGTRIFVPLEYNSAWNLNYGMQFNTNANRLFGYGSLIEWDEQSMQKWDFNKLISYSSRLVRYSEDGSESLTPYEGKTDLIITDHTNNKCFQYDIEQTGINSGYRAEMLFRITDPTVVEHLKRYGTLQRFIFDADYFIPSNPNSYGTDYSTTIFQIHDGNFSVSGWVDPPPVGIRFQNGKLYAQASYIANAAIPDGESDVTKAVYELCNLPFDEWFNLRVECRVSYRDCMIPYLSVSIDGNEKLNTSIPIGYNIITSGGYTYVRFGLYCPHWKRASYQNAHRNIKISNIKYEF